MSWHFFPSFALRLRRLSWRSLRVWPHRSPASSFHYSLALASFHLSSCLRQNAHFLQSGLCICAPLLKSNTSTSRCQCGPLLRRRCYLLPLQGDLLCEPCRLLGRDDRGSVALALRDFAVVVPSEGDVLLLYLHAVVAISLCLLQFP